MKKFKCESCGGNRIEEVMCGVTQSSEILEIENIDGQLIMDYGNTSTEDGDIDSIRYQCMECGTVIYNDELMILAD